MSSDGFIGQHLELDGKEILVVATREVSDGDRAIAVDEDQLYYVVDLAGDAPRIVLGPISELGASALAISVFDGKCRTSSVSRQMLELATALIIRDLNMPVFLMEGAINEQVD